MSDPFDTPMPLMTLREHLRADARLWKMACEVSRRDTIAEIAAHLDKLADEHPDTDYWLRAAAKSVRELANGAEP